MSTEEHVRTVSDLLHAYERDYLPGKAPRTQYCERLLLRWFAAELGAIPLTHLTPLVLRTWRESLRRHYKPNTVRRYLTALSAALTVAVDRYAWLPTHPLRRVGLPPAPPDRVRYLEEGELQHLLRACRQSQSRYLYLVVVLALATGCRKNELMQRQWSEIDVEQGIWRLPQTKNGERRAIPVIGEGLLLLRQHAQAPRTSPWVFPRLDGRKPVLIDDAWCTARQRAGLVDFHFHDLRHTTASYLAMSGASLREIAEVLGHKTIQQTMKYAHLVAPHTRGVVERMVHRFLQGDVSGVTGDTDPRDDADR